MSSTHNPTKRLNLSRRQLLRFGGAAAALSPFIPVLRAQAQESGPPKRILFYITHNGTIVDEYFPEQSGRDFEFKRILAPLEPFKDRVTVISGLDMEPHPGGAHTGQGQLLTNTVPNGNRKGMGISVDQFLAQEIGGDTPFSSLLLGNFSHATGELFLRGPADTIPAENNPYSAFERIFGDVEAAAEPRAALEARRGSVIDRVLGDLNSFRATLGPVDQSLMDLHLESVRDLERNLSANAGTCGVPDMVQGVDDDDVDDMPLISQLNNQLFQTSLGCDLVRVAAAPVGRPVSNIVMRFAGADEGWHNMSHENSASVDNVLTNINTWFVEQIADLATRLEATPEADGSTLLDNTLIVFLNPLSVGRSHSKRNLPTTLIGGGWHFDIGQHLSFNSEPNGKFLVSLCHAMGVDINSFGDADGSEGPLSGLAL